MSSQPKSRQPEKERKKTKTYRSLPKNGSAFPPSGVTHNHGAPNAPFSSASAVTRFSTAFISSPPAAATISATSPAVNSFSPPLALPAPANPAGTSASALATAGRVVRSGLGGDQKR